MEHMLRIAEPILINPGFRNDQSLLQCRAGLSSRHRVVVDPRFQQLPAYIDGVNESVIEDDKGGDEVGGDQAASAISATGSGNASPGIRTRSTR